ncbi:TRM11 family SAM-dependent methyltransferase [Paenibacillus endoradicis]|uniref:TRM11 family SAM-dependent methyltransferase n=1 Tax=Paenibacillus endoradicis TaxID=2972487 RepID=UPI002158B221|nr:RNA methyltransferase [Paenibacillus endoradicis]MCR8655819.1 RNA methyltransferase [Paenibacillus endoradicis]MCR8658145.1 RNA methyltransferase [Paenibacillus endoradicis]
MIQQHVSNTTSVADYVYRITCHEQERSLCSMEMRALWGVSFDADYSTLLLRSEIQHHVNRSPFVKYRLAIWCEGSDLDTLIDKVSQLPPVTGRYKVIALDEMQDEQVEPINYQKRRIIEQSLGSQVKGEVDLKQPELLLGVTKLEQSWVFGVLEYHDPIWQRHNDKPRHYSTALSTKVARSLVNIAVPTLKEDIHFFDPCCGIGTVLMEACSQGIQSSGGDINPLAVVGARENMAAFDYHCEIRIHNMIELETKYDVVIVDLPYNHCSVLPQEERYRMLKALSTIASRVIIVSVEPIKQELVQLGYYIEDEGCIEKSHFKRDVFLCTIS